MQIWDFRSIINPFNIRCTLQIRSTIPPFDQFLESTPLAPSAEPLDLSEPWWVFPLGVVHGYDVGDDDVGTDLLGKYLYGV